VVLAVGGVVALVVAEWLLEVRDREESLAESSSVSTSDPMANQTCEDATLWVHL
jgi:hypothetical protein